MKESIGGREMQQVPSHLFFNSSYVSNLYEFIAGVADTPVILHYMNSLYCEAQRVISCITPWTCSRDVVKLINKVLLDGS
jgi:hypothetical protein